MTNTNLTALRNALENDKIISEDARYLLIGLIDDADEETTIRDLLDVLEDGEALANIFADEPEIDEEIEARHIAIVEEAYAFLEDFGY